MFSEKNMTFATGNAFISFIFLQSILIFIITGNSFSIHNVLAVTA